MKHLSPLTRTLCLVSSAALLATSACDCGDKPTDKPVTATQTTPATAPQTAPPEDPLKAAREDADRLGVEVAMTLSDKVQLVGAEIEAASKPVAVGNTPKIRKDEEYKGKIDPNSANRVLRDFEPGMKLCYERSLKRTPSLEGTVDLEIAVNPDGSVQRAIARAGSLRDSEVNACMQGLAAKMKFDPPEGGRARLLKKYNFTPQL